MLNIFESQAQSVPWLRTSKRLYKMKIHTFVVLFRKAGAFWKLERILHAMVGYHLFHGNTRFALFLLLGFYACLRTGELLALRNKDVMVSDDHKQSVLFQTKGGKRSGAAESVTMAVSDVVRRLAQWKQFTSAQSLLTNAPQKWRRVQWYPGGPWAATL